ncbi:MAG: hypothetical protein ACYCVZ_09915 [Streptosporangiaceae bacterium]
MRLPAVVRANRRCDGDRGSAGDFAGGETPLMGAAVPADQVADIA